MKNQLNINTKRIHLFFVVFFLNLGMYASTIEATIDTTGVHRFKGVVIDGKTKNPLIFANLAVNGTNISTVTNSQGEFILKVPKANSNNTVTVSFLGYTSLVLKISDFDKKEKNTIKLETYIEELSEIKITVKDAKSLVAEMLKRKNSNYFNNLTAMTSFYRETIKKRRAYVSLAEAIVEINKQSYTSSRNDILRLYKSRKSTDYDKLDTVAFKLKGGPFSTLHIDIMKNVDMFFGDDFLGIYDFTFGETTKIDNRPIYVVNFKQKSSVPEPFYYGTLYIDSQTLALTNAKFQLNLKNIDEATKLFVVKKPRGAAVTPVEVKYQVDYKNSENGWHYSYSRIELGFKINWDRKWFNTIYYTTSEMAITDWEIIDNSDVVKPKYRMRPTVIMIDEASGFSDPDFWGEFNVIEPEKPIESAIKKIQRQLNRS